MRTASAVRDCVDAIFYVCMSALVHSVGTRYNTLFFFFILVSGLVAPQTKYRSFALLGLCLVYNIVRGNQTQSTRHEPFDSNLEYRIYSSDGYGNNKW